MRAIICDLDGTLANDDHRRPVNTGTGWGEKEYNDYYAEMHNDTPFEHIREILHRFEVDHKIIFLTGRPMRFHNTTAIWIAQHAKLNNDCKLLMRPDGDYRCDTIIKTEIYNNVIAPNYKVTFVLEDRKRVVKMWRSLGLRCLEVAEADF